MNDDEFYGAVMRLLSSDNIKMYPENLPPYSYIPHIRKIHPELTSPELYVEWYLKIMGE